jgi:hypothetical protein
MLVSLLMISVAFSTIRKRGLTRRSLLRWVTSATITMAPLRPWATRLAVAMAVTNLARFTKAKGCTTISAAGRRAHGVSRRAEEEKRRANQKQKQ